MNSTSNGFLFKNCYGYCSVFGNNLQGSSHRLKAVGGAYDKRKDLFMKKVLKRTGKVFCLFLLIVVLVNVLSPLFCRKPDEKYVESLRETEFTSETEGTERICCIDDNEESLLEASYDWHCEGEHCTVYL